MCLFLERPRNCARSLKSPTWLLGLHSSSCLSMVYTRRWRILPYGVLVLVYLVDPVLTNQGPVVRRVDNFIQWINPYPADKMGALSNQNKERANFIRWIKLFTLRITGPRNDCGLNYNLFNIR